MQAVIFKTFIDPEKIEKIKILKNSSRKFFPEGFVSNLRNKCFRTGPPEDTENAVSVPSGCCNDALC